MAQSTHSTMISSGPPLMARRKRRWVLRVSTDGGADQEIELQRARVTLGRSRSNHVTLGHDSVSSVHAELRQTEDRVELVDLGSRNGTLINGRRVVQADVMPGDVLRLGQVEVKLLAVDDIEVPLASETQFGEMLGQAECMREVFAALKGFAMADINLLITGETGTGKELAARAVHRASPRANGPFEVVDCGKLVPTLAASALFGHTKGAFTGADRSTAGAFERAHRGTIFLDEVGELTLPLQLMLLRVLDRREVTRIGESNPRPVNLRVVAATHRNLAELVADGSFREDLFFRLVEGDVELPPLRERKTDLPWLAAWLLEQEVDEREPPVLTPAALEVLMHHRWPGNVRELRNVLRRALVLAQLSGRQTIEPRDVRLLRLQPKPGTGGLEELVSLGTWEAIVEAVERVVLPRVVEQHAGKISPAAAALKVSRRRLKERMVAFGFLPTGEDAE